MDNRAIAEKLIEAAHHLERRRANLYRIRAYRRAAQTVLGLDEPLEDLVAHYGRRGLKELPGIGASLSERLETLVRTGEISTLTEAEPSFASVN